MTDSVFGGPYKREDAEAYFSAEQYREPKESFKLAASLIRTHACAHPRSILDLGCASGAFIHYLSTIMPGVELVGVDLTPDFIEMAQRARIPNARFHVGNLLDQSGQYDVVTCLGTVGMFEHVEPLLEKAVALTRPGGVVVVDGFFNEYDHDVRVEWRRNPGGVDVPWRTGFNQFSRGRVTRWLDERSLAFSFHDLPFTVDLERHIERPAVNAWTFRDESGQRHLTNGLSLLLRFVALAIRVT